MDGSTSTIRGGKLARSQAACILEARSRTHSPCEYEMCRVYQYIHTTNKNYIHTHTLLNCIASLEEQHKHQRVGSGLQSVFQSKKHQVCDASNTSHLPTHTRKQNYKRRRVRSGLQSVFQSKKHQVCDASNTSHLPTHTRKQNYKRRRVRSGLQSVFQSKKHQVCDASNTSHLPTHTRKQITSVGGSDQVSKVFFNHKSIRSVMHLTHHTSQHTQESKITSVGGSDQVSKVFFNQKSIRSVMHQTHHTSQHTQESKLQASEGQIRSPKCFSITKASGL